MIILMEFGRTGEDFISKADLKLVGREFKGLWGWQGSSATVSVAPAPLPVAPIATPRAPVSATPRRASPAVTQSGLARPLSHAANRSAQLSWHQIRAQLQFRKERGVNVTGVGSMLKKAKREATHVGKAVARGKRRHSWPERHVFKAPRKGGKPGGDDEWVATEQVLKQMYEDP